MWLWSDYKNRKLYVWDVLKIKCDFKCKLMIFNNLNNDIFWIFINNMCYVIVLFIYSIFLYLILMFIKFDWY